MYEEQALICTTILDPKKMPRAWGWHLPALRLARTFLLCHNTVERFLVMLEGRERTLITKIDLSGTCSSAVDVFMGVQVIIDLIIHNGFIYGHVGYYWPIHPQCIHL